MSRNSIIAYETKREGGLGVGGWRRGSDLLSLVLILEQHLLLFSVLTDGLHVNGFFSFFFFFLLSCMDSQNTYSLPMNALCISGYYIFKRMQRQKCYFFENKN